MYGETEARLIIEQLREYQKKVLSSPEAALAALQRAGLVDEEKPRKTE